MPTTLALTENSDGSIRLAVTGAPTPGAALVNDTFDASAANWQAVGSAALTYPAEGQAGNGLAVTGPIGGPNATKLEARRSVSAVAGQLYEVSAWVRTDDTDATVALWVEGLGTITPELHTEGWTLLRGTFQVSGAVWVYVRTTAGWWSTTTSTGRTRIDGFKVVPVAAGWRPDTPIVRSDVNGTRDVRLAQSERITAGALTVDDHEAAATGLVSYTLTDPAGVAVTASLTRTIWRKSVLLNPHQPSARVELAQILELDHQREAGGTVTYDVADVYPAASGTLRARAGRIRVYCTSHAAALELEDLAASSTVLMLRQADRAGADRYLSPRGTAATFLHLAAGGAERWAVTLDYVETRHPKGHRYAGPAWTYAALADSGLTYATLPAVYDTYADLAAGVQQ